MTEPEPQDDEDVGRCEQCGEDCDDGEPYCSYDCCERANAWEKDYEDADPERCDHPWSAWRSCERCKDVYGDLQYQRMKEGDL